MSRTTDRNTSARRVRTDGRVIARSSGVLLAGTAALALVPGIADSASAPCQTGTVTLRVAGCYVVPAGVTKLNVVAIGARGNLGDPQGDRTGGRGGRAVRNVTVQPGQTLYAQIGVNGTSVAPYNGGASDLRKCAPGPACVLTGNGTTDPRLIVGAGGGMGGRNAQFSGAGGLGGDAGASGADGQRHTEPEGSNTFGGAGGGPGMRTAPGRGGAGGAGVVPGLPGLPGTPWAGGEGGGTGIIGTTGGRGGAGFWGGGGGGQGGYTKTGFAKGTSHRRGGGGGGGGGFSYAPGGTVGIDTTGVPSVTVKPLATG